MLPVSFISLLCGMKQSRRLDNSMIVDDLQQGLSEVVYDQGR